MQPIGGSHMLERTKRWSRSMLIRWPAVPPADVRLMLVHVLPSVGADKTPATSRGPGPLIEPAPVGRRHRQNALFDLGRATQEGVTSPGGPRWGDVRPLRD
ncbi:hypothetical protein JCM10369A_23550 [Nocardioides pyridinolyticus]